MNFIQTGCKSGYGRTKLPPGVRAYVFPKDEERRRKWIKAIPRSNWSPSAKAVVCSLHFEEADFRTERKDSNPRRKLGNLKNKCLNDDAIPRFFPNLPQYLTSVKPKQRSTASTSTARQERL
jgi:hypothetical protein